jgi:aryl-alcohol dehydrogenase-like predicted oxidoreductase
MSLETREIAPGYAITRLIRGGWQLAGGHGTIDRAQAVEDLLATFDAGVTTFDCADIYTGVEDLYGALRERLVIGRCATIASPHETRSRSPNSACHSARSCRDRCRSLSSAPSC